MGLTRKKWFINIITLVRGHNMGLTRKNWFINIITLVRILKITATLNFKPLTREIHRGHFQVSGNYSTEFEPN